MVLLIAWPFFPILIKFIYINTIIFGVKEQKDEKLEVAVSEILETVGEKLFITQCCRIYSTKSGTAKPIKARVGSEGEHHFFDFHICERAVEDKQVEKKRIRIRLCIPEILRSKV